MSYAVTNKAKRPIVCPLGDKTTLRLPIDGQTTITEAQMTEHIKNLSKKGHLVLSVVEEKPLKRKNTTQSSEVKEEK